MRRRRVWLVQQGVRDMPVQSMPLACGYLKATVDADPDLVREFDVRIFNFGGGDVTSTMASRLFFDETPDVIAFSVMGWNCLRFAALARTFRELNSAGWIVFGGTHVANQGREVFRRFPEVDVVVDGEGELTFRDLLRAIAAGRSPQDLGDVAGLSFQGPDREVVTTAARERIRDLDVIPSPFLTGVIPLLDQAGAFPYDVALMETNRGCPYQCSFCYWGGAIGQKIRSFSIERLRAEVDLFARHRVASLVLCDSNFGLMPQDQDFIEIVIEARARHGFPKHVETSWAKNKGKPFRRIVRRMMQTGLHSSFTLALQSLSEPALDLMQRRNMSLNQWEDLAEELEREGMALYGELIWSVPGETSETFLAGYDRLARRVPRIATYPLLLMPNTAYSERRDEHGFVTVRGERDDYDYVLAHRSMTFSENSLMHRFLFWARTISEHMVLYLAWRPAALLAGMTQSEVLLSLDAWIDRQTDDPVAEGLRACRAEVVVHLDASRVTRGIHYLAVVAGVGPLLQRWWDEEIVSRAADDDREFLREALRFDLLLRPIYARLEPGQSPKATVQVRDEVFAVEEVGGELYLVRRAVRLEYPVREIVAAMSRGETTPPLVRRPGEIDLYYKVGFDRQIDNHDGYPLFTGKTLAELTRPRTAGAEPPWAPQRGQPLRVFDGDAD